MPPARTLASLVVVAGLAATLPLSAGAVTGNGRLQIHHIDVGQGDGLLIISPQGQTAMVDDGVYTDCTKVKAYLQSLGVTQLDYHFASHYHADHIGCIDDLAAVGITVQVAGWDRAYSYSSSSYTAYVGTLGARRRTIAKNQVILLDSLSAHPVVIKCVDLNGAGAYSVSGSDENPKSVVLKVSYGEFDAVLGGDLTGSTAQGNDVESTVGPEVGPVEVYKVHHHGSRYSSNQNWLLATQPKVGIISCGNGNSYGHPTAEALSRLHAAFVHTYWTETGAGASPDPLWDRVANGHIVISATWEPAGVDTVRGPGFADTFVNSGTVTDQVLPTVAVTSPDGGEVWKAGSTRALLWTASDNVAVTAVDLLYSDDGGFTFPYVIATGIANTGSYSWVVPNTPTTAGELLVMAHDAAGNVGLDLSNGSFTIDQWRVVASAGPGGVIDPSGSLPVIEGANQGFAITPAAGYFVSDVLVDGASVGAVGDYTFTGIVADHTIAASFANGPLDVGPGRAPALALAPPFPNPGHHGCDLRFSLPRAGSSRLEILDLGGRQVWRSEESLPAGTHTRHWNGLDPGGEPVGPGMYFVRLVTPWGVRTVRAVQLR